MGAPKYVASKTERQKQNSTLSVLDLEGTLRMKFNAFLGEEEVLVLSHF